MAETRPRQIDPAPKSKRHPLVNFLSLERNVTAASTAVFLLGLGEELWLKFLPKYLERLGASTQIIGLFGTAEDFFDAMYQYPGGWLADKFGRRRALLFFIAVACVGYVFYFTAQSWPLIFVGLAFSMAWHSMASPVIFAVIGDSLPKERRAMGFTFQSMLKRLPMIVAPLIGGAMIARYGIATGLRTGFVITLGLAAISAVIVMTIRIPPLQSSKTNIAGVWRSFHSALKRLLISDIVIRTCEGMAGVFVILYATNVVGVSAAQYGVLVAIQMTTSLLVYLPAARIADKIGRKPFVIITFLCFALFPVSVVLSHNFVTLILAFVVGGLREIGEPSRKAMIVDFAEPSLRARSVGLYYLIRCLTVTPAAAIGGVLWKISPATPFITAGIIGFVGVIVFAITVEERYAG